MDYVKKGDVCNILILCSISNLTECQICLGCAFTTVPCDIKNKINIPAQYLGSKCERNKTCQTMFYKCLSHLNALRSKNTENKKHFHFITIIVR